MGYLKPEKNNVALTRYKIILYLLFNLKIDLKAGKFIKIKNSGNVTCVNPDYSEGL